MEKSNGLSNLENFEADLMSLINKYSIDNYAHTPDFILADLLMKTIQSHKETTENRERWFGRDVKTLSADSLEQAALLSQANFGLPDLMLDSEGNVLIQNGQPTEKLKELQQKLKKETK